METFDFTVKIEATNRDEAREIALAMVDIMKTIRKETSAKEFVDFAAKLKANPSLVRKAQRFL